MTLDNEEPPVTVREKLARTFSCHPRFPIQYTVDGKLKERVAIHDTIHLLIMDRPWPVTFRITDEYSAAIVQAVLRRDAGVSYLNNYTKSRPAGAVPTLEEIQAVTLPGIPTFMQRVLGDWCMKPPEVFPPANEEFVRWHYEAAQAFDRLFTERYSKPFSQVTAPELMDMEFQPLKELFQQAAMIAGQKTGWKEPPACKQVREEEIPFGSRVESNASATSARRV